MNSQIISKKAPGKLILIGEYAVLEGANALVCAVNRFAETTICKSNENSYILNAPSVGINKFYFDFDKFGCVVYNSSVSEESKRKLTFFKSTIEYVFSYFKNCHIELPFFNVTIDTDAFYSKKLKTKLGFGSSAALTVSLVKTLFAFSGRNHFDGGILNKIFRLSLAAHHHAQSNLGSGIDIAASAFGGVLQYCVNLNEKAEQQAPERIDTWNDMNPLVVWSGDSESTRKMVAGVGKLKNSKPDIYNTLIRRLIDTSQIGCNSYRMQSKEQFLEAIKEYYHLMNELGKKSSMPIISEVHQDIANIVEKTKAVYKPSGAGSGDIGVAFANDSDHKKDIEKELNKSGYSCIDVEIEATF